MAMCDCSMDVSVYWPVGLTYTVRCTLQVSSGVPPFLQPLEGQLDGE